MVSLVHLVNAPITFTMVQIFPSQAHHTCQVVRHQDIFFFKLVSDMGLFVIYHFKLWKLVSLFVVQ